MVRKLDHEKAISLRLQGKSYGEIAKDLGVWKSSLSGWLKGLQLSPEALKILEKKSNYSREKFADYNRIKHEKVQMENKQIRETFSKKIKPLSNYELLLIGTALYWGEGCKRHSRSYGQYASLCNSDPYIIKIFIRFVREILKIQEERLKPSVHIYPTIDAKKAIIFWSNITNIPKNKFHITSQVSRASQGKRPKNLLPYGTLEVRVPNRQRFFEIMGLIDGLIKQTI